MTYINNFLGCWKFSNSVPLKDLNDLIKRFEREKQYLNLYIRNIGEKQSGLFFEYKTTSSKKAFQQYIAKTSQIIKGSVGTNLIGWDISSRYYNIK